MKLIEIIDKYVELSIERDELERQIKRYHKKSEESVGLQNKLQQTNYQLSIVHKNYVQIISKTKPEIISETIKSLNQKINDLRKESTSLQHRINLNNNYGDDAFRKQKFRLEQTHNHNIGYLQKRDTSISNKIYYYNEFIKTLMPEEQKKGVNLRKR